MGGGSEMILLISNYLYYTTIFRAGATGTIVVVCNYVGGGAGAGRFVLLLTANYCKQTAKKEI